MGNVRSWNALASAEQRAPNSPFRAVATFLLTFQVHLRILWMNVMPRCHNCQTEYAPENALRKGGYQHFFPECRDNGVPKKSCATGFLEARQTTLGARQDSGL
jgi:hypothetical protein